MRNKLIDTFFILLGILVLFIFVFVIVTSINNEIEFISKKVDEDNSQTIQSKLQDFEDVK